MFNRLIAKREKKIIKKSFKNHNVESLERILDSLEIKFQNEKFCNVPVLEEIQTFLISETSKQIIMKNRMAIEAYGWRILDISIKESNKRTFIKDNCVKISRLPNNVSISFLRKLFLHQGKLFNIKLIPHKSYSVGRIPTDDEFYDAFVFFLSKKKADSCITHPIFIDKKLYSLEKPYDAEINMINEEYHFYQYLKSLGCLKKKDQPKKKSSNIYINKKFYESQINDSINLETKKTLNNLNEKKIGNNLKNGYQNHDNDKFEKKNSGLNFVKKNSEVRKLDESKFLDPFDNNLESINKRFLNNDNIMKKNYRVNDNLIRNYKVNDNRSESLKKKMRPRLFENMNYGVLRIHVISRNVLTTMVKNNHHFYNIQFRSSPANNELIYNRLTKLAEMKKNPF